MTSEVTFFPPFYHDLANEWLFAFLASFIKASQKISFGSLGKAIWTPWPVPLGESQNPLWRKALLRSVSCLFNPFGEPGWCTPPHHTSFGEQPPKEQVLSRQKWDTVDVRRLLGGRSIGLIRSFGELSGHASPWLNCQDISIEQVWTPLTSGAKACEKFPHQLCYIINIIVTFSST